MAETGLRTWLKEMAKGTKEQKEPVLIGTEYVDTKRLIQQYEEEIKYHQLKLEKAEADLAACRGIESHAIIVGEGFKVKGYGLLIPMRDDLDVVKELTAINDCMRNEYGLGSYLTNKQSAGKLVLYPYPVTELAMFFPEFMAYNLVQEVDKMKRSCEAAYRVQVHKKAIKSIEDYIQMEENAATISGNRELAERLKESDTTLMLSLAAGTQTDNTETPTIRQEREPTPAEIEASLNEMAYKDYEIKTPSTLNMPAPEMQDHNLTGVDVVNQKKPRKKIKKKEKKVKAITKPVPAEKAST